MSTQSKIEWTDTTWNPVRGCSRVSEGCRNCYAERQTARFSEPSRSWHGFVRDGKWTGRVELIESKLREPLSWRKPRRVFVNSMSDLFHESLPDEAIDRVFAVMALASLHTFQVLTKRPERMRAYFTSGCAGLESRESSIAYTSQQIGERLLGTADAPFAWDGRGSEPHRYPASARDVSNRRKWPGWPLPNVWLGTSVEDQQTANERIPHLLRTPAAIRFVSAEPLIAPVDVSKFLWPVHDQWPAKYRTPAEARAAGAKVERVRQALVLARSRFVDWLIVGGESGPGARPCDVAWIRSIVEQCKAASVACFVKQLGAVPFAAVDELDRWPLDSRAYVEDERGDCVDVLSLRDRKGGDPSEWPKDLRVREFPDAKEDARV